MNQNSRDFTVSAACGCNKGLRRGNNEDNFYFDGEFLDIDNDGLGVILTCTRTISGEMDDHGSFFAVYDGMGGGQYGEVASYTAAAGTGEFLEQNEDVAITEVKRMLEDMCLELNRAVFAESEGRSVNQMGSTAVGCYFRAGHVWTVNVGDSRCYRFRSGELSQISVDHNDAETMKLSGITGRKPYITQYLGIDPEDMIITPSFYVDEARAGDIYLICSDGLSDMVDEDRASLILSGEGDEEEKVQSLLVEALKKGGRDNVTIIACTLREAE